VVEELWGNAEREGSGRRKTMKRVKMWETP